MNDKIFTIFAGVNGAGKSTLYNLPSLEKEKMGIRINTDEIVRTFGDWKNEVDQLKAGKIAIKLRKDCIEKGLTFNQETTLCGNSILKIINQVNKKGYKVHLYYIGVNSPKIAKERIKARVAKGGHDIPSEIVERRYYESLENLKVILPKVDKAEIYDNSDKYKLCLSKVNNQYKIFETDLPNWIKPIINSFSKENFKTSKWKKTSQIQSSKVSKWKKEKINDNKIEF